MATYPYVWALVALITWVPDSTLVNAHQHVLQSDSPRQEEAAVVVDKSGSVAFIRRDLLSHERIQGEGQDSREGQVDDPNKERPGWCSPWHEGTSFLTPADGDPSGVSYFPQVNGQSLQKGGCWEKCKNDAACEQAVFDEATGECWLGLNWFPQDPGSAGFNMSRTGARQLCFAKNGFGFTPPTLQNKGIHVADLVRPGFCLPFVNETIGDKFIKAECKEQVDASRCSYWPPDAKLSREGCFAKCRYNPNCKQAVFSLHPSIHPLSDAKSESECFLGTGSETPAPGPGGWDSHCDDCQDTCYSKTGYSILR